MIAKLEFNLDKIEDKDLFEMYNKSSDYHVVLFAIFSNLRRKVDREIETKDYGDEAYAITNFIFRELHDLKEEYNINL